MRNFSYYLNLSKSQSPEVLRPELSGFLIDKITDNGRFKILNSVIVTRSINGELRTRTFPGKTTKLRS